MKPGRWLFSCLLCPWIPHSEPITQVSLKNVSLFVLCPRNALSLMGDEISVTLRNGTSEVVGKCTGVSYISRISLFTVG